ncbi:MFS transporter [Metabacillus niabensis]|uniref:MFS family permease n=1 Tax=Metabacillus niabensis TaxID=324854 RepID=A0ABT9Z1U3_9BACI|nr:MFS transporter [Metabacillus niabensis]MDQ0226214.1 MFS family permease [Metabacillus niabensis]
MEYTKYKNSKSVFVLYIVCISAFFASLNQNIYSPIIPLIKDSFHVTTTMVNLTVSLFIFITAIMQIIFGTILDIKGSRIILIPSLILTVITSVGCAVTTNFTLFFVFRLLQAFGTAAIPLIASATITDLFEGNTRGSAMGTYQTLLSIAPAVAPIVGGIIGDKYNYNGIFWVLVSISVLLLVINTLFFPTDQKIQEKKKSNAIKFYHFIVKDGMGSLVLSLSFLNFLVYFSILVYLPILLTDHYHLHIKIVGWLYLPITISLVAGSLLFKFVQWRISLITLFTLTNIIITVGIIGFGFTHTYSLLLMSLSLLIYGIGIGILTPTYATIITNKFEQYRASAMGVFNFVRYTGMAAGPILISLLLESISSELVFTLFGILFGIISSFSYFFVYKTKIDKRMTL